MRSDPGRTERARALRPQLALLAVMMVGGLSACGDKIDAVPEGACTADLGALTYEGQVKTILDAYCAGCHAASKSGAARNGAPPSVNLDSYAAVSAVAAKANQALQNGVMPPGGGVPAAERMTVQCWLDQGGAEK